MKIDWTKTFTTRDGKPAMAATEEGKAPEPATLKHLVLAALDNWVDRMPATEKYERYKCIKAINEDASLTTKEVATCIKAVEEFTFIPFIHGQIMDVLDDKEEKLKLVSNKGEA